MKHKIIIIMTTLIMSPLVWANDLVVHEWGTFTSFMGSDGIKQFGMHEEEEELPNFVYGVGNTQESQDHLNPHPKPGDGQTRPPLGRELPPSTGCPEPVRKDCGFFGFDQFNVFDVSAVGLVGQSLPRNPIDIGITQKMETPVIYFYGQEEQKVKVDIDFPQGIISQYYPKATSYTPKYSDVSTLGPSSFTFDVTLKSISEDARLPYAVPDSIWLPARQVQANTIQVGNEQEKFIFYRGVADFDANFKVTSNKNEMTLTNLSSESVREAFVLLSDGEKGKVIALGQIYSNKSIRIPDLNNNALAFDTYVRDAKSQIAQALIKTGLYSDEAQAMVNTWEKSYFHNPGLRVLYVVPNLETEKILPLTVSPKPQSLIRTLIGRVEVMTKTNEVMAIKAFETLSDTELKEMFGRFLESKLRRIKQIVTQPEYSSETRNKVLKRINALL